MKRKRLSREKLITIREKGGGEKVREGRRAEKGNCTVTAWKRKRACERGGKREPNFTEKKKYLPYYLGGGKKDSRNERVAWVFVQGEGRGGERDQFVNTS